MTAHLIAEEGPLQGLILNLEEDIQEWVVGKSHQSADLVIDDETISRKHAKLYRTAEGIYLENFSHIAPITINQEEIHTPTLLKEGDLLQIGATTFLFAEVATPAAPDQGYATNDFFSDDTIFEDNHSEEGLHFSVPSHTPLLLKVISGPNAGAEIGIEKGHSYTLGKDAHTADILFQDLSVSRTHARLFVLEDGSLEIEDLGSKNGIAINGIPIQEKQIFTSQDLVALGTTIFIVIDREAPQETIYSPLIASHEATAEATEAKEQTEPPEETSKQWKKEPIPLKHLIFIGSAAAIFLFAFLSFFSLFKSKTTEIVHKEPASEIKEALSPKKFAMVEFSFNPMGGKLFLVGHVLTAVDYQEMRFALSQIPFITHIEDTVVIDEGIAKEMNDVLSSNTEWQGIAIRVPEPGKFFATGYLQTNEEMGQVSEYFLVNFPYLDRLENKISVEENLNTEIASILSQGGFSAVTYQLTQGNLLLSGVYDQKKENSFKHLTKQLQKIPGIVTLKNLAIPTHPKHTAINISSNYRISGISVHDGKGFNAILNGTIYTLGDSVGGMLITDIEPNAILLEKDGIKYKIDYMLK